MNTKFSISLRPQLVLMPAFFMLLTAFLLTFTAQAQAQAFPVYSWGNNSNGQLGHGITGGSSHTPTRIDFENDWVFASTASGGSFAINASGELFAWGGNSSNMGQGISILPARLNTPTQIGTASNWEMVSSRGTVAAAINSDGQLYTWGAGGGGILGHGGTANESTPRRVGNRTDWAYVSVGVQGTARSMMALTTGGALYAWGTQPNTVPGGVSHEPTRVGTASNWTALSNAGSFALVINSEGHLFAWGNGDDGRLGQGDNGNRTTPTRIGNAANWREISTTNGAAAAINTEGELWTWGSTTSGQIGRPVSVVPQNLPGRVGEASNWVSVHGGNTHFLAFNEASELWAWGSNGNSQLGIGVSGGSKSAPEFAVQTYGFSSAARGGGSHSLMIMTTVPAVGQLDLTKTLEKPYGTPRPEPLTFSFSMLAKSFNDDPNPVIINDRFPAGTTELTRTITIDDASTSSTISVPTGNIVSLTESTNILAGIEFDRSGVYSWIISEKPVTDPAVNPPSKVAFSQAQYELRVYVRFRTTALGDEYYVYAVTVHRLRDENGVVEDPPIKIGMNDEAEITFTNRYTRLTSTNQHLNVHKYIEGQFANLQETFTFTATLNKHSLCTLDAITARVFNQNNVEVATHTFTATNPTVANITLSHNWRIVFDPITIGSSFEIEEDACPLHIASVRVYSHAHPTTPQLLTNSEPNQPKTTNTHIIGANTNAANFRNAHQYTPPTGLIMGNAPYALFCGAGLMFVVTFVSKARKRIEDTPVTY